MLVQKPATVSSSFPLSDWQCGHGQRVIYTTASTVSPPGLHILRGKAEMEVLCKWSRRGSKGWQRAAVNHIRGDAPTRDEGELEE